MRRHRWIKASWPIRIRDICSRLQEQQYTEKQGEGFIIDRARDSMVEARFVQRLDVEDEVVDPYGHTFVTSRVSYTQVKFVAFDFYPGLEIIHSSAKLNQLTNRLSQILDFSVSFSTINVDVLQWALLMERSLKSEIVVSSIQASDIELGSGVKAKSVVTGVDDVRGEVNHFLSDRERVIDKVKMHLVGQKKQSVVLTRQAVATLSTGENLDMIECARGSLQDLINA